MDKPSPSTRPSLCVFCGSSHGHDPLYAEAARRFGTALGEGGFDLVFGGGGIGLMGELARAASAAGAHVLGVIPAFLRHVEPPTRVSSELLVTDTMNERKARMFEAADGFAVLAGGLGTLDELSEALTYAQLHVHAKPVVIVNTKKFFTPLIHFFDQIVAEGFARNDVMGLFEMVDTPEEAITLLKARVKKGA
jgi:uncharacterized protein (TIGR00730 family)